VSSTKCLVTGKDWFSGEREASWEIGERGWTGDSYPYYCDACDGWHIAHYKTIQPALPRLREAVITGRTRYVERLSHYRGVHCCELDNKLYTFVYNKRNKSVWILKVERFYGQR